ARAGGLRAHPAGRRVQQGRRGDPDLGTRAGAMTTLTAPAARLPRAPSGERRVPLLAAFALATLLTACANEPAASAGAPGGEAPAAADEPRASPIAMSPRDGPPGTDV